MNITIIETSGLGDRGYVVDHDGTAVVIDPQRDIDRVQRTADERRCYGVTDFSGLNDAPDNDHRTILDVRQRNEYDASHLPGALNIPLHELLGRIDEVPDGDVWVHCVSGYRSSIAASMLDRSGRTVVLIDDDYHHATAAGLTTS